MKQVHHWTSGLIPGLDGLRDRKLVYLVLLLFKKNSAPLQITSSTREAALHCWVFALWETNSKKFSHPKSLTKNYSVLYTLL